MNQQVTKTSRQTWIIRISASALAAVVVICAVILWWSYKSNRSSFVGVVLGGTPVAGVEEAGFFQQEYEGQIPFRWTTGNAMLAVPLDKRRLPKALQVTVRCLPPKGIKLNISVNGKEVFNGHVSRGEFDKVFKLTEINLEEQAVISLVSDTWKPNETFPGLTDQRGLGVSVKKVCLLKETPDE